jgi:hypothetical protein
METGLATGPTRENRRWWEVRDTRPAAGGAREATSAWQEDSHGMWKVPTRVKWDPRWVSVQI